MTETIDIFRTRADRFSSVVSAAQGRWDAPSPCEQWTAGDIVHHVIETEQDFLNRHGLPPGRGRSGRPVAGVAAAS